MALTTEQTEIDALNESLTDLLTKGHTTPAEEAPEAPEPSEASDTPEAAEAPEAPDAPDAPEATDDAPPVTKLTLAGREVEVSSDIADLVRREIDTRAGVHGSQIQDLREQVARLEGLTTAQLKRAEKEVAAEDDVLPPDPELLNPASDSFDPKSYQAQMIAYQEAVVVAALAAIEERRQTETATTAKATHDQQVWTDYVARFYESAPELADKRDIVTAVYRANFDRLKALPSDADVYTELRRLANARIHEIAGTVAPKKEAPKAPTLSSSRPSAPGKPAPDQDDDDDASLASLGSRARRAAIL